MAATMRKPRTPPTYNNRIHGHAYFGDPLPGETEAECEGRTRIWCAIGKAPDAMKDAAWRVINPAETTALAVIYQHGESSYTVGDALPVRVSYEEDKLLTAFATQQRPMSRKDREDRHGISNAPRAVTRLVERYDGVFARAIRRPKVKCKGGYFAKVRPAR